MIFYNIILPIIITVVIGTPLAIYAGVVAGRILVFYQIKSECLEVLNVFYVPYYSSEDIKYSERKCESKTTSLIEKLDNLGHTNSSVIVGEIYLELSRKLSEIETSFVWSEARQKDNPKTTIEGSNYYEWSRKIHSIKPNLWILLKPNFKV